MPGDLTNLGSNPRSGTFSFSTSAVNVAAKVATALGVTAKDIFYVDIMDGDIAFTFGFSGSKVQATQDVDAAVLTGTDYPTHQAKCVDNAANLYVIAGGAAVITFVAYLYKPNSVQ